MVYSFDIFDTCFVRACGRPENIFDIVARKIFGSDADDSLIFDFSATRIASEKLVRRISKHEEVTLVEIYSQCSFKDITDFSAEKLAQIEIDVEKDILVPVYDIKHRIASLRNEGHQIYFISDMYLPSEFIEELLKIHGFWQQGDKLYVSSSCLKTKATGNLYRLIAETNNLKFKNWTHYGDNEHSDYKVPKKLGIKAKRVIHNYTYYENSVLKQNYYPGIFVNELLSGISKAVRLSLSENIHSKFASDLIAPVYVPFVLSILQDAKENGIKSICFLARDGQIFYKIALHFSHLYPEIKLNYIHVSRASLYFPGIDNLNAESLLSIIKYDINDQDIFKVLRKLIAQDVCEKIEGVDCNIKNVSSLKESCYSLFENEKINKILNDYHALQRKYVLKYFIQEGLASLGYPTAIVDLRGSRSCQKAINNILSSNGYNEVKGYYFDVLKEQLPGGEYFSWYYESRYLYGRTGLYLEGNVLEEYFCLTNEPRTIGYNYVGGKIYPIYDNSSTTENEQIKLIHDQVVSYFCELYLKCGLYRHVVEIKYLAVRLISDFMITPKREYLKCLRFVKQRSIPLINLFTPTICLTHNYCWQNGSLIYTFRTAKVIKLMNFMRKIKKNIKDLI